MSAKSNIEILANLVGEPEIIEYLECCSQRTLNHVERCLHSIVAADAHPSAAYQSRIRAGLMDDIWSSIWECDYHDYMKGLILDRIVFAIQRYGRHDQELRKELRILSNLWDKSSLPGDLCEECEVVEDWDYLYLESRYLTPEPSLEAIMNVVGRAVHYIRTGSMVGTVSAREAANFFGWE